MARFESASGPLTGILEALVTQKNALLRQAEETDVFDKALATNLDMVMRSIERTKTAIQAQEKQASDMRSLSLAQMREFLKSMDERIEQRVEQRLEALVESAPDGMCERCADALRRLSVAHSSTATARG